MDYRIACSTEAGKWLFRNNKFTVIKNGINLENYRFNYETRKKYRSMFKASDDTLILGHVGRFTYQKNHQYLIKVLKRYTEYNSNVILLLAGTGELEQEVRDLVNKLDLSQKVIFLGTREDINGLMQCMDVFLLPSYHEGLPVVGIEAQTAGLPCILSDNISKETKMTENVVFTPISDENVDAWCRNIDLFSKREIVRKDGYQSVKDNGYDIQDVIKQVENIYETLANDKTKG